MGIKEWNFYVSSSPKSEGVNRFVIHNGDAIIGAFDFRDPDAGIALAVGRLNDPFHIGRSDWSALSLLPADFLSQLGGFVEPSVSTPAAPSTISGGLE